MNRHWLYCLTRYQMILGQKFGLLVMKMVGISIRTCQLLKPILGFWQISDISIAITLPMCWICLLKLNTIPIPIPIPTPTPIPIPFHITNHIPTPISIPIPHSFSILHSQFPIPHSCSDISIAITPPIYWICHLKLNDIPHSPFPITQSHSQLNSRFPFLFPV